ncbi:hypothetical protein, partial [Pseudomonas aeruginosa]
MNAKTRPEAQTPLQIARRLAAWSRSNSRAASGRTSS